MFFLPMGERYLLGRRREDSFGLIEWNLTDHLPRVNRIARFAFHATRRPYAWAPWMLIRKEGFTRQRRLAYRCSTQPDDCVACLITRSLANSMNRPKRLRCSWPVTTY